MCPESIRAISQLMKPNWILMNRWKELSFFFFLLTWWKSFMRSSLSGWFNATLSLSLSLLSIPSFKITSNTRSTLQRRVGTWKQKTNVFCTGIIYHLCVNSVSADIMKAREEQIPNSSCHLLDCAPPLPSVFSSLSLPIMSWIPSLSPPFSVLEPGLRGN